MNSKFLYAATVAVSLISTLAMADEAPVTREQVKAELAQARAARSQLPGPLASSLYNPYGAATLRTSSLPREQVAVELAQSRAARQQLSGPLASSLYNPDGVGALQHSTLARSEVKQEVREAIANGTLPRTDYDDAAQLARQARAHTASATLAQRFKARFANGQS